jgi:hypothetical protein
MLRNVLVASAVTVSVVVAGGCQEAKEKTKGTMSFVKGDAEAVVERTPSQVIEAARAAGKDLGLIFIAQATTRADEKDVQVLTMRTTEDKKVTVRVTAETDKASRLTVNTGLFGDSALRQQVMDRIKTQLGLPVTTQPTTAAK